MPATIRRIPGWPDHRVKPDYVHAAPDFAHPLCPKWAWLLDGPNLLFPESIGGAFPASAESAVLADRPAGGVSPRFGAGAQFATNNNSAGLVLGPEASIITANGNLSILLAKRKTDATVRAAADFGILNAAEPGSFAHRCGANIPWSDGQIHFDYGGVAEGASRLSVGGLTYGDDLWLFTVGPRGMEIWQNGIKRASNAGTPTRTGTAGNFYLGDGQSATGTQVDFAVFAFIQIYHRQLSTGECVEVQTDPFQWLRGSRRRPIALTTTLPLPQHWDEAGAVWDQLGAVWDPAPAPALFAGALRGTGVLDGFLIVGAVDLLGDLLGRGTLAASLGTGALFSGALTGTGLLTGSMVTGISFVGAVLGEGFMVGVLAEAPPGQILIGALQGFGTLAGFLPGAVVFIPHLFGPDSPVSQTPDLDLNFNALLTAINAPNVIGIGLAVDRPAPGRQGAIWVSTDANDEWYMDDGLQWQTMGAFGQGMVVHDRATDNLLLLGALAAGAGATHVLAAGKATAIPTQALVDGAVLYVADTQGLAGRAAWHHLSEAGHITPLDPVIFRDGIISRNDSTAELTLWAAGVPTLRGKTLPGRYLEVWWHGEVANNTAAVRTLVLRLRFGGVELCAVTLTNVPISATAALASVLFRLDGLTGAVQLAYPLVMTGVGTITAVLTGGTLDASLDQPLDVTGQWNFQSPSLQVRTLGLQVTLR